MQPVHFRHYGAVGPRLYDRAIKESPKDTKQPRSLTYPDHFQGTPAWSFLRCDMDGPFGWKVATQEDLLRVMKHLGSLENSKLSEIFGERHRKNHQPRLDILGKEAKKRLTELNLAPERLVSIRLTSSERIWAIRNHENSILSLLWWDPNHLVYPSKR